MQIALEFSDLAEMTKAFDALGRSGKIAVPLRDEFWGAKFGMLTDAFGVQ